MMRFFIIIGVILSMTFRVAAQDKLLVAGSGNPYVLLVDQQPGKVEWKHALEKGEECNTVALTRKGEVLYSYKRGAKLVTWDHQVVWDYQTPDKTELQSATLLRNGGVLLGICGNPARFIELDKNGKKVNEVLLDLDIEKPHSQFRQVFQLRNKNYLIPVMAKRKIPKDGSLLLPCGDGHYYMVIDRRTGKELKRVTANDIPGVSLLFVGQIAQLENQNLLICNWYGHTKDVTVDEPQLIEVDKDGKEVWRLHDKKNVGKISAVCYLKDFRLPDLK